MGNSGWPDAGWPRSVRNPARTPVGVQFGAGAVLVIGAGLLAALVPRPDAGARFTVVCAAVGVFAVATIAPLAAAGVAALGRSVVNGFQVNQFGQLNWHGPPDLYRTIWLVVVGAVGLAVGKAYRQILDLQARWRFEAQVEAILARTEEEETRCVT